MKFSRPFLDDENLVKTIMSEIFVINFGDSRFILFLIVFENTIISYNDLISNSSIPD